jgi:hypothetical protein
MLANHSKREIIGFHPAYIGFDIVDQVGYLVPANFFPAKVEKSKINSGSCCL